MYDYLIVGAGLFGNVWAHEATKRGKKCLVIDRRNHIGGNTYCENVEGINVHYYGAHIFHTNDKEQPNRDQATAGTSTRMGYDGRLEGLTIEAAKVTNGVAEESNEANLELVAGKDDALLNRIHSARTFEIRMHNNMITVHPLN